MLDHLLSNMANNIIESEKRLKVNISLDGEEKLTNLLSSTGIGFPLAKLISNLTFTLLPTLREIYDAPDKSASAKSCPASSAA